MKALYEGKRKNYNCAARHGLDLQGTSTGIGQTGFVGLEISAGSVAPWRLSTLSHITSQ